MKKLAIIISMVLIFSMVMAGCNKGTDDGNQTASEAGGNERQDTSDGANQDTSDSDVADNGDATYSYEGNLKLTGIDGDIEVAYNDIFNAYASVTQNVHSITSSGDENDDEVTGVLLNTILADYGVAQSDFSSIRLIAGDGYEITVPVEIIAEHDIILAYEFNGEGLEEKKQPLRIAIDGVRSMYFVSNLVEIVFSGEPVASAVSNNDIILLETAISQLESEEYVYYDSTDLAVTVADLLDIAGSVSEEDLSFLAADGYEKTETMAVFSAGYIKFTGEDAPLFIDPDIQKGMYIKSIMKAEAGDKTFVSVASAMTALGTTEVNGKTGVPMTDFFDMMGVDAELYIITATDGYEVEIPSESLQDGVFYIDDETGTACMKFTEDHPGSWGMKDIMTISPVLSATSESADDESSEEASDAVAAEWTIVFQGLSDGSFDFTSERAAQRIELVALHTEKEKDGVITPEDWTGYRIEEILEWLHVESYGSLTIIASDGYSVEIPAADIDNETIIAITKNGEPLASDIVVQLVQNTQFATTWVKAVATVVVNP